MLVGTPESSSRREGSKFRGPGNDSCHLDEHVEFVLGNASERHPFRQFANPDVEFFSHVVGIDRILYAERFDRGLVEGFQVDIWLFDQIRCYPMLYDRRSG